MNIIEIFQGLLTPVIGVVAVYIAWQQWETNRQRLKLERYERRLRVYEEVIKILSIIYAEADVSLDDLRKFRVAVSEADFLFGPEIPEYLDEIFNRGVSLRRWNKEYRDHTQPVPPDYDNEKVVAGALEEVKWLAHQFAPAKEKFKKYLDISEKRTICIQRAYLRLKAKFLGPVSSTG